MSTYNFTCPLCHRTFSAGIDHWSWPFVFSKVLIHLDAEHSDITPVEGTEIAEGVADKIAAELVRLRLLGR